MNRFINPSIKIPFRSFSLSLVCNNKITKTLGKTLPLEEFLFRQRVLHIYRDLIRLSYKTHEKEELIRFIKNEFKLNSQEKDLNYRKYILNQGIKRINDMVSIMGIGNVKEFK